MSASQKTPSETKQAPKPEDPIHHEEPTTPHFEGIHARTAADWERLLAAEGLAPIKVHEVIPAATAAECGCSGGTGCFCRYPTPSLEYLEGTHGWRRDPEGTSLALADYFGSVVPRLDRIVA